MKVKVEQLDDDEDDEEEEEPQSRKLHPLAFSVFIIPVGCLLTYMIFDHELAMSGYILSICSGITGMILYFTLFLDNGDQHKDEMMREVEYLSIEDAFAQLQMMAVETQETLFVINVLRKKIMYQQKRNKKELARIKKDKLSRGEAFNAKDAEGFEVDLAKMGVVQHLILILQTCETVMDKRVGPGLELINSIISEVKARDTLFDTADNLRDVVDSYVDLIKRFLSAVPDSKMLSSPAAEKKRVRCGMTACIAFTLMSMYCPMAQTRIGDRGGLYFIYNFCFDKDYISNVLLAQWGACCVMSLTSEHPPNKGEVFQLGGINAVSDLLKLHPTNVEIVRYALKILHNLIADEPKSKYSLLKARQICLQQANMTELLLGIKKRYPTDAHISTISSTTLQLIASTMS